MMKEKLGTKVLSLVLTVLMLITLVPTNVYATTTGDVPVPPFVEGTNQRYSSGETVEINSLSVGDRLELGSVVHDTEKKWVLYIDSYEVFVAVEGGDGSFKQGPAAQLDPPLQNVIIQAEYENSNPKWQPEAGALTKLTTRTEWVVYYVNSEQHLMYITSPDRTPKYKYDTTITKTPLTGANAKFELVLNEGNKLCEGDSFTVTEYDILKVTITPESGKSFTTAPTITVTGATAGAVTKGTGEEYTCEITAFTGSVTITVNGTAGVAGGQTDEDRLAEAKPLAEKAITDITTKNDTTAKNILDAIKNGISSVDGVTASWKSGSPTITPATKDNAGSITGTIVLKSGSKTVEVTVYKVINKLSSITNIVDDTTGTKIEYENGSSFDSDVQLIVTSKSKEEMKKYQDGVDKVAKGMSIVGLYDIKLLKDGVEIQPNGKLKITLSLTDEMKAMSDLQVVYIDDNGNETIVPSQLIDGKLVFVTDHFSYYGVIGKEKSTGQIQPETPSKPNSPQTGDTSNTMLYFGLIILSGCLAGYGFKKKKALRR